MILFLFSFFLLFTGCSMKSFTKIGYAPYCLVKYQERIVDCSYATMTDCRDRLVDNKTSVCFPSRDLKLKRHK